MQTILEFLKWWYTELLVGDVASWTWLPNLFGKTAILGIGLLFTLFITTSIIGGIIKFLNSLIVSFQTGWNRTMNEDKKH